MPLQLRSHWPRQDSPGFHYLHMKQFAIGGKPKTFQDILLFYVKTVEI